MDYQPHQLMDEQLQDPKEEADEADIESLLQRTYGILETVLQGRLKDSTRNDVLRLRQDVEDVIWFHHVH